MEQKKIISVIVPVYNVEPYLRQCLDSIVNQTYRDLEILIIDDGSTDGSGSICDEYKEKDERIRVFHTDNRGLSAARNLGLDEARGEYIAFVDSDDWIELDMYEMLLNGIGDADISVCGYTWERAGKKYKPYIIDSTKKVSSHDALKMLILGSVNNNVWNKLYCGRLFDTIRFPEGHNYEDVQTMHILLSNATFITMISNLGYHRNNRNGSIIETHTADNLVDNAMAYISRFCYFRDELPSLFRENKRILQEECTENMFFVWRWWHCVSNEEKLRFRKQIKDIKRFAKQSVKFTEKGRISKKIRLYQLFMKYDNRLCFGALFYFNQLYRWVKKII